MLTILSLSCPIAHGNTSESIKSLVDMAQAIIYNIKKLTRSGFSEAVEHLFGTYFIDPDNSPEKSQSNRSSSARKDSFYGANLKLSALSVCSILLCGHTSNTFGAEPTYAYSELKAAFILNFPNFISWSRPSNAAPRTICSFSDHALADSIEMLLASSRMTERKAKLVFHRDPDIDVLCDFAFVGIEAEDRIDEISAPRDNLQTLVISDIPGYAVSGGMIELARVESKIKVIMNRDEMASRRFRVDSRLLQLVQQVTTSIEREAE
jgi:hypothetical protein